MSTTSPLPGVLPTRIKKAGPASLCSVYIQKICSTASGDKVFGRATGFHYRDILGRIWLITNWHVLTGRRPDDSGFLITKDAPQSPYKIEVTYSSQTIGQFHPPFSLELYPDGKPIWRQYRLDLGNDVAAIPLNRLDDDVIAPAVQDFADRDTNSLVPGQDVVIIGFPFEHSVDMPFPIWKRAMVASEPGYTVLGQTNVLLDTPGCPGMSGSPVYRVTPGVSVTREQAELLKAVERGEKSALDVLAKLDTQNLETVPALKFIGIYSGATGETDSKQLQTLSLGRMMMASVVDLVVHHGEPGENPFIPEKYEA